MSPIVCERDVREARHRRSLEREGCQGYAVPLPGNRSDEGAQSCCTGSVLWLIPTRAVGSLWAFMFCGAHRVCSDQPQGKRCRGHRGNGLQGAETKRKERGHNSCAPNILACPPVVSLPTCNLSACWVLGPRGLQLQFPDKSGEVSMPHALCSE